jgi:hypothetical protein
VLQEIRKRYPAYSYNVQRGNVQLQSTATTYNVAAHDVVRYTAGAPRYAGGMHPGSAMGSATDGRRRA